MKKLVTILALCLCSYQVSFAAYGFDGHQQTTVLQDNSAKNMLQNQASGTATSTITGSSIAETYVNFQFDTSGKSVYLVYTTNNTEPTKTNGTVVTGSFHNFTSPDRTWTANIPGQAESTIVKYIFYISDSTLSAAWGKVDNGGYVTSWSEGSNVGFSYTVAAALPVELATFRAQVVKEAVQLTWKTVSESNNDGFYVQCSSNGKDWKDLNFVKGAGTSTLEKEYQYVATNLPVGTYYFRLKQQDYDGTVKFSDTVNLTVEVAGQFMLNPAYPNPFNPASKVEFAVPTDQDIRLELYNLRGQNVQTLFSGNATANTLITATINGENLPSGTYFIRFVGANFSATQKVVLMK